MTEDSLPTDILAHMIAINNVPPPPLRSIPRLKVRKTINYGQLNALCHIRGLESRRNSSLYLAAHDTFIKQYPQIFLHEKTVLPKVPQPVEKRKSDLQIDQKISQPVKSHNISLYLSEARGGPCINEGELSESKFQKFLDILKKLPVYRTIHEHNFVWKMLKNIPALTSQLRMIGDDGLYIMLTGHARRRVKVFRSLIEEEDSIVSSISRESFLFDVDLKDSTVVEFYVPSKKLTVKKWGVFGSLEVRPDMDECERSIVTDDDCEILKIPTKEYEKLKLEKVKRENAQKLKLIRKCPFYEIWPTLSIYELVSLSTFKIFPPGHVLVESGDIISFVGFINSGYCNIYRNIVGLVDLSLKVKKIKKLVYMGKLKERESFGEISILLQSPFTCTIITGREVEMAIIEDKDILALDPITKELMIQTAKPTFGHLTEEDVKNEYIKKVQEKEWKYFKNKTIQGIFQSKGVLPGFGKWEHDWSTIPKNFKSSLITYT
ncbi:cyclic nucleotide-binding domain-containing protein 1 isoform X4 [Rattus norvegicus]|uniref:cyclic nucleotide binding domain containing 1 isoform 2 n=1 Tax=Rattus norvegicus TaxID=10116 RepID=UPI00191734C7|nr:cyclic nucleotide-binding domain-containing protein 1 isoform X2 [Rattus norvegicus]